ncbi:MAG: enoyl-CoA hydratase-related protein [Burkholderiaceae bacterium]
MDYKNLSMAVTRQVAWITIERPAAFNALDLDTMGEFLDAAERCATDRGVRAVVITGSGEKAFCAGGDVAGFVRNADDIERLLMAMTTRLHTALSRLAWMDAPVVGMINGVAAGAGLSLAAACDLAIAAEHARFTSAYTQIGMTPDGSSTYYLPRLIGNRRAIELYLTNRTLTAAEALDWGLVNRVVPGATLRAEVEALAEKLAQGPSRAYGGVKKLLMLSANDSLESQMERETRSICEMSRTADGREGTRAFVEKRKPNFTGG